jgi:hypothetical protein
MQQAMRGVASALPTLGHVALDSPLVARGTKRASRVAGIAGMAVVLAVVAVVSMLRRAQEARETRTASAADGVTTATVEATTPVAATAAATANTSPTNATSVAPPAEAPVASTVASMPLAKAHPASTGGLRHAPRAAMTASTSLPAPIQVPPTKTPAPASGGDWLGPRF